MSTRTPTYAVQVMVPGCVYTPAGWPFKHLGAPSDETLAKYVEGFEASTRPGGCNAHLGRETVAFAKVTRQATGETVATYRCR